MGDGISIRRFPPFHVLPNDTQYGTGRFSIHETRVIRGKDANELVYPRLLLDGLSKKQGEQIGHHGSINGHRNGGQILGRVCLEKGLTGLEPCLEPDQFEIQPIQETESAKRMHHPAVHERVVNTLHSPPEPFTCLLEKRRVGVPFGIVGSRRHDGLLDSSIIQYSSQLMTVFPQVSHTQRVNRGCFTLKLLQTRGSMDTGGQE